jgi:hypothetical protein
MAFKDLDDDRIAPDESAAAMLPLRTFENLGELVESRRMAGSVSIPFAPQVSVPPEMRWGFPFLIPRHPLATSVRVDVLVNRTAPGVNLALMVDGITGDRVTLAASSEGMVAASMTCEVRPPDGGRFRAQYHICFLVIESLVDESPILTDISFESRTTTNPGRAYTILRRQTVATVGPWLQAHLHIRDSNLGGPIGYVGAIRRLVSTSAIADLAAWNWGTGADGGVSVYQLGSVAVRSMMITYEGVADVITPPRSGMQTGARIRPGPLIRLHALLKDVYTSAGQFTMTRPTDGWYGRVRDTDEGAHRVLASTVRARQDATGIATASYGYRTRDRLRVPYELSYGTSETWPAPDDIEGAMVVSGELRPLPRSAPNEAGVMLNRGVFTDAVNSGFSAVWGGADLWHLVGGSDPPGLTSDAAGLFAQGAQFRPGSADNTAAGSTDLDTPYVVRARSPSAEGASELAWSAMTFCNEIYEVQG